MKKTQNKKGFTLTELIVVIVIIGILAAVLIPTLTGYINKANQSAAEQEASTYVTAYNSWVVEKENGLLDETNDEFLEYVVVELEMTTEGLAATANGYTYTKGNWVVTYDATTKKLTTAKANN